MGVKKSDGCKNLKATACEAAGSQEAVGRVLLKGRGGGGGKDRGKGTASGIFAEPFFGSSCLTGVFRVCAMNLWSSFVHRVEFL